MTRVAAPNPNVGLIGKARSRERLATPALLLDLNAFERNIARMAALCARHGMALRPHAKTHKSTRIAQEQLRSGAIGISVATLREAAAMVITGIKEVLITSPLVGATKLEALMRLLAEAGSTTTLMGVVDALPAAQALEAHLRRARRTLPVLMDIDPGMRRTGVADLKSAVKLAQFLQRSQELNFVGVQYYSGMVQHIARAPARARTYGQQLQRLERILRALARSGVKPQIVSGGGTGTFDLDCRAGLFTDCQAGSYIFMDAQYNEVELFSGGARPFATALYLQSTVISNNHRRRATIDAGFKSFAMDGPIPVPAHGMAGRAKYHFYGDEFGVLTFQDSGRRLALGSKVEFVTPHCDPTVNLHAFYHCVRGNRLVDIWSVDARGPL